MSEKLNVLCLILVLLSSATFAGPQAETETVAAAPEEEGEPQYGGTLTAIVLGPARNDPPNPDVADNFWYATQYLRGVLESPLIGDYKKYGPRGTNEFSYTLKG